MKIMKPRHKKNEKEKQKNIYGKSEKKEIKKKKMNKTK